MIISISTIVVVVIVIDYNIVHLPSAIRPMTYGVQVPLSMSTRYQRQRKTSRNFTSLINEMYCEDAWYCICVHV